MKKILFIILSVFLIGCVANQSSKGPYTGDLVSTSSGVIYDKTTGLMWASKDNGYAISWIDAKQFCENYQEGGYTDWRLPTLDELSTLYNENTSYKVSLKDKVYDVHLTDLIQLSSISLYASNLFGATSAYVFSFTNGERNFGGKGKAPYNDWMRVLPVRNGLSSQPQNSSTYPINGKWKISGIEKGGKYVEAKFKDELAFIFKKNSFDLVVDGESLFDETYPKKISYSVHNGKIILSDSAGEKLSANIEFFKANSLRASNFEATQMATTIALSVKAALTGKLQPKPIGLAKNTVLYFSKIQK